MHSNHTCMFVKPYLLQDGFGSQETFRALMISQSQPGDFVPLYGKSIFGWWFQICLFSSLPGEMIQFDYCFSNELKPPSRY